MIGLIDFRSTGLAVLDAEADFRRARRRYLTARALRWLFARASRARHLPTLPHTAVTSAGLTTFEVVPLKAIVGAIEGSLHFDARFRPASERVRPRWQRVALAHRRGIPLPPITLVRAPDGYYVVDGRHRVSVARALGHRDIDAWVRGAAATGSP